MKIAKVRTTNYGLERSTRTTSPSGLERLEELQRREAAEADAWVSGLSRNALAGIARDLCVRIDHDRSDPWQRWRMARKGAALRALTHCHA